MTRPTRRRTRLSLAMFVLAGACDPEDARSAPSCEAVADHVERLCGPVAGAMFAANIRQIQCAVADGLTLAPSERKCALAADSCEELEESDCAPGEVLIACDGPSDCDAPLQCDTENEQCVRCFVDDDCGANERCLGELCFAADSEVVLASENAVAIARCLDMCQDTDPMDCQSDLAQCRGMCTPIFASAVCEPRRREYFACVDQIRATLECDPNAMVSDDDCDPNFRTFLECRSEND